MDDGGQVADVWLTRIGRIRKYSDERGEGQTWVACCESGMGIGVKAS